MGSRYPPQGSDGRFPRGRTPPRFGPDRRPSAPQGGFQPRNSDSSYRPSDDLPREPPRGPKGLSSEPSRGAQYTPRGRGGYPRGRGGYDSFTRRDSERSWPERRETFDDRRPSPIGRGQSRSPPPYRDRDPPDSTRGFDSPTDHRARGGYTSRGRGGYDRGRGGRPIGSQDRDRYRSRSRERYADDSRDDRDRDNFRREDDRWDRGREASRRDGPPIRPESRIFDEHTRTTSPSTASSASGPYGRPPLNDTGNSHPRAQPDKTRRSSFPASAQPDARVRDEPRQPQSATHPPSSPPLALSVPAYGSDTALLGEASKRPNVLATNVRATTENAKITATSPVAAPPNVPTGPRADTSDPLKVAPKGPKADLAKAPPQQGVRRSMSNTMPPGRPFEGQEQRPTGPSASPKIPSGPRALTGRPIAVDTNFSQSPSTSFPNAPRSIPTGPKALNMPALPSSNVWTRPTPRQPPSGPSSAHPAKRESFGESTEGARPRPRSSGDVKSAAGLSMELQSGVRSENGETRDIHAPAQKSENETKAEPLPEHLMDIDNELEPDAATVAEQVPDSDFALPQSDDEDAVSDDGMSEEDLRAQEAKFEREKEQLESKRPIPDKEDTELFLMLDELDAFAVALDDIKQGRWPLPKKEEPEETGNQIKVHDVPPIQSPIRLPTPPPAEPMDTFEDLSDEDEEALNALPYRRTSPPTPMSQLWMLEDEEKLSTEDDAAKMEKIAQLLAVKLKAEQEDVEDTHVAYRSIYRGWRDDVEEKERLRQAEEEANAAADTGADQSEPPAVATPSVESTRGRNRGFNTQLDLDQALALSKQTHAEEQARVKEVERDMLTAPDMTRESLIPSMLVVREQQSRQYTDNSNGVDTPGVVDIYKLIPPEDDFTPEEQDLFKKAYEKNARKQWGHIAKDIPGRNYKDCIMHYYLTKREHKYKRLLQKKAGGRKGRQGKGKTNALLSDLTGRSDVEGNGKVEVTDTGRPKRAAAPTNFDRRQQQEVETVPQRGRGRGKAAARTVEGAEGVPDKPTRGRGSGRERGRGRGKAASGPTAPAPGPVRRIPVTDGPSDMPTEEAKVPSTANMEDARLLTEFHSAPLKPIMPGHTENWLLPQQGVYPTLAQAQQPQMPREIHEKPVPVGMPEQQVFNVQTERSAPPAVQPRPEREGDKAKDLARPPTESGSTPSKRLTASTSGKANQSSSYWSVMEQNQVLSWAPFFGKNWDEYSIRMKAKSAVMVRNHVQRLTADGKNANLADDLVRAEEANKLNPNRIEELTAAGTIEPPLGLEPPANLQRPLAPSRKTSGDVKQERDEKPGRPRADSHVPVAPKPASQAGSLEASPANRPRGKSSASLKTSALAQPAQHQSPHQGLHQQPQTIQQQGQHNQQQQQQQQSMQPHNGPQAGYFDPPTKIKEKLPGTPRAAEARQVHPPELRQAHSADSRPMHTSEHRQVPVTAPSPVSASLQEARPSSENRMKWSITTGYTPHQSTISNYATYTGVNPRTGLPDEPQQSRHVSGQQPQYPQQSPYARHEERPQPASGLHRHDSDPSRNHQASIPHSAPDERSTRMPLHVESAGQSYQHRSHEAQLQPQPPVQQPYFHSREPARHSGPQQNMGSLLREEQASRPSTSAVGASSQGSGSGMPPPNVSSGAPTPNPQPIAVSASAPPAPAKRSNIMDILNSNDPEPPPKRITTESRAPAPVPTPPPSQNPVPPPPYQALGQSQYSSRPPVQQQFGQQYADPYARRDTPPDRTGVPSHPSQHPAAQYEAQRQALDPRDHRDHRDPRQLQAQQHHYGGPPPSHIPHEHARNWPPQSVQQGVPPPQHAYPPEPPRYSAYSSHSSPQPTRPSYAPPPQGASQYQSAAQADPRYRAPSPAHHSRGASLSTQRPSEHTALPPSVYSSRPGPPQGMPGGQNPLLNRPPSAFGAGSPLVQEQMRHPDDRERDRERERDRQRREGPYSGVPSREYARTPHGGYPGPPPPPHYQQQPPPR